MTSLISVCEIEKRRPRKENADSRDCSFRYIVRVKRNDSITEIPVCAKAFISFHGVTRRRLATIQASMKNTGRSPKDNRGCHKNRPWRHSEEKINAVHKHISSLKGRVSHYSKEKTDKIYLPDELSITKLYEMYSEKYPHLKVSLETYRKIFNEDYNISFGYPRTDTCSTCDKLKAQIDILNKELSEASANEKVSIENRIKTLTTESQLHKMKSVTFYTRKRESRKESKKKDWKESICMDFQKSPTTKHQYQ